MTEDLNHSILRTLFEEATPMSLPRIGKRLGVSASALMRALTLMGTASLGGQQGPGWVQVELQDERWTASLTDAGRDYCAQWAAHG